MTAQHSGAPEAGACIARGAEASLVRASWLGRAVLEKRRVPKAYRHPSLDARLRAQRTRDEAWLLMCARRAGVAVPIVYDADLAAATLRLEEVPGPTLHAQLRTDDAATARRRMMQLGEATGRLHAAGITHGDLTTMNVLVQPERLVLIDFGLGALSPDPEGRGVDLHLVEEALAATQDGAADLMAAFLAGYAVTAPAAAATLARLEEIRARGRYR